ncbi:MAG TPA: hypothetical protein VLA66_07825 [Thermoanaerobaculia bacterium]|nr:hypothetical protein [Thermoanaerobaculia bacterium]
MKLLKIVGVVLVVLGILALVYKGFNYTQETHEAKLGPLELSVADRERVEIPTWVGVVAVAVGAGLLLVPPRR